MLDNGWGYLRVYILGWCVGIGVVGWIFGDSWGIGIIHETIVLKDVRISEMVKAFLRIIGVAC